MSELFPETIDQPTSMKKTRKIKSLSRFQSILIGIVAGGMMLLCIIVLAFGPNDTIDNDKAIIIEQIRQEKLDYIQMRTTAEDRQILESTLTNQALQTVKKEIQKSQDPSSVDIDARVNELMGL